MPTALITGAAGGIGQALCQEFRQAGYQVIGLDRPGAEPGACDGWVAADLRQLCQDSSYRQGVVDGVRSQLSQPLQVLINNAAVQVVKPAAQLTAADWHHTLDVNLVAPFLLAQACLAELEAAGGSIINIASIHASLTKPEFVCYATSKAALAGLTRSLAVDLGSRVRVNAIAPAAVATPMLIAGFADHPEQLQQLAHMHPLGRIADPAEVAQAALFLASDQAGFISGTVLELDGGIGGRLHDPI